MMTLVMVFAVVAVAMAVLVLVFRRRTIWFLLERRRQATQDFATNLSFSIASVGQAAWERVPARVRTRKAGTAAGAFLGSALLAVAGSAALYGEVAQAVGTACAFAGCASSPNIDIGLALGLAVVSGVVFWSVVLTELAGFTNFSGWIRPDNLEVDDSASEYEARVLAVRKWALPVLSATMLLTSVWVLVQLALYRDELLRAYDALESGASLEASMAGLHATGRFWAIQAVTMSVSAAFGAVALKDFLTLTVTTVAFGVASVVLGALRLGVEGIGTGLDFVMGLGQDVVHLIEPAAEQGLREPYDEMGFWREVEVDLAEDDVLANGGGNGFGPIPDEPAPDEAAELFVN